MDGAVLGCAATVDRHGLGALVFAQSRYSYGVCSDCVRSVLPAAFVSFLLAASSQAQDSGSLREIVAPFVRAHCVACHSGEDAEGGPRPRSFPSGSAGAGLVGRCAARSRCLGFGGDAAPGCGG